MWNTTVRQSAAGWECDSALLAIKGREWKRTGRLYLSGQGGGGKIRRRVGFGGKEPGRTRNGRSMVLSDWVQMATRNEKKTGENRQWGGGEKKREKTWCGGADNNFAPKRVRTTPGEKNKRTATNSC